MSYITGIHHVALKCANENEYNREKDFYGRVLGLKMAREWATGVMFDTGSGIIEIFNNAESQLPDGTIRHFALAASDVDAVVDAVRAAGYPITTEPKDIAIPSTPAFPARIAFCRGPIGEEIEFFDEK